MTCTCENHKGGGECKFKMKCCFEDLDDVERFIVKRLEAQQFKLEAHMAVEAKVEELLSVIG